MSPKQHTIAQQIIQRSALFGDSDEVAANIRALHRYWGPEAHDHILGMWGELQAAVQLLRDLAAGAESKAGREWLEDAPDR